MPPKTEYRLTDFGRTLSPIIEAMQQWGNTHLNIAGSEAVGSTCGMPSGGNTHLNIAGSEESEPLLEQGTSEP